MISDYLMIPIENGGPEGVHVVSDYDLVYKGRISYEIPFRCDVDKTADVDLAFTGSVSGSAVISD